MSAEKTTDGIALENSQVRVKINKKGEVTSFVLKESGREFAADALNCFHFYKDVPRKMCIRDSLHAMEITTIERFFS